MELQIKCRLCASDSFNGVPIFSDNNLINDLSSFINQHLPLKVEKDEVFSNIICQSCNLQLHATIDFFDKIRQGQDRLQTLLQQMGTDMKNDLAQMDGVISQFSDDNLQMVYSSDLYPEIEMNHSRMSFTCNSNLHDEFQATEAPKRRGRPRNKKSLKEDFDLLNDVKKEDFNLLNVPSNDAVDSDSPAFPRVKRKRQLPLRYQGAVQDKELDRMINGEPVASQMDQLNGDLCSNDDISRPDEDLSPDTKDTKPTDITVNPLKKGRKYNSKKQKQVFVCDICGLGFLLKCYFTDHRATHEGSVIECKTCSDTFLKEESYKAHCILNPQCTVKDCKDELGLNENEIMNNSQSIDFKKQDFPCDLCDKIFSHEPSLALHKKAVHEDLKPFVCSVCNKSFNSVFSLKTHLIHLHKKKTQKGYPCEICGKLFNHPSSVIYHRKAEHTVLQFNCDKCDRSFKHKQLLMRHQLVHSDVRPFACKSCGAAFKTKPNLMNHQSVHSGEKKHICELCGQQFAHKTSLKLHYRWHAGQKPFKCETCGKSFSQKGNLQEHNRIHTGEKPFACVYCERKFTTSSQYKLHVKRHVGERPWQCDICPKTFLHRDTWKCHIRRHRGEKPFACTYCSREFSEQWALKKHLRLHTGEKPYSCEICHKSFSDCSNLTKHKKVHDKLPRNAKKEEKIDLSVWKLIKSHIEQGGDKSLILSDDKGDGVEQIIYVTYDDSNAAAATSSSSSSKQVSNNGNVLLPDNLEDEILLDAGLAKSLQMTDELGNPVHFAMLDGGELQLTSGADGQALQVVTQDGHTIPVQITNIDEQSSEPSRLTLQLTSQIPTSLPNLDVSPPKAPVKTKRTKASQNSTSDQSPLLNQPLRSNILKKPQLDPITEDNSKSLLTSNDVETSSSLLLRDPPAPLLPSSPSSSQKTSTASLLQNLNRNISSSADYFSKQSDVTPFVSDSSESILLTHTDGSTSLLQTSALTDKGPNDGVLTIDETDPSQSIEFMVDGQKLRLLTSSLHNAGMQIPVEFLNIN